MNGLNKQTLMFPRLVFLRDGKLVRKAFLASASNPAVTKTKASKKMTTESITSVRIYRLDWSDIERIKTQRINERMDNSTPRPEVRNFIPRSYVDRMERLEFAIPDAYMKAINHMCLRAMEEWEQSYPFDTIIREKCYKSVVGYMDSAFTLLSDCVYNSLAEYYERDHGASEVFRHTGMLRFWREQTGLLPSFEFAGFQTKMWNIDSWQPWAYPEIDAMHHDMRDYLQLLIAEKNQQGPTVAATPDLVGEHSLDTKKAAKVKSK